MVFFLNFLKGRTNERQAFGVVGFVNGSRLVFVRAVVLDPLAGLLDFGKTKSGG